MCVHLHSELCSDCVTQYVNKNRSIMLQTVKERMLLTQIKHFHFIALCAGCNPVFLGNRLFRGSAVISISAFPFRRTPPLPPPAIPQPPSQPNIPVVYSVLLLHGEMHVPTIACTALASMQLYLSVIAGTLYALPTRAYAYYVMSMCIIWFPARILYILGLLHIHTYTHTHT